MRNIYIFRVYVQIPYIANTIRQYHLLMLHYWVILGLNFPTFVQNVPHFFSKEPTYRISWLGTTHSFEHLWVKTGRKISNNRVREVLACSMKKILNLKPKLDILMLSESRTWFFHHHLFLCKLGKRRRRSCRLAVECRTFAEGSGGGRGLARRCCLSAHLFTKLQITFHKHFSQQEKASILYTNKLI